MNHASDTTPAAGTTVLPIATPAQTFRHLGSGLRRRKGRAFAVAGLCLITAASAVIPLLALGVLVDRVTAHADVSTLVPIATTAAIAAMIGGIAAGATVHSIAWLGADLLADLREDAVVSALQMRADVIETAGRGDLLSRVNNDVTAINRAVTTVLPTVVTAAALGVVTLAAMVGLDWRLAIGGALAIPLYVIALRWYLPRSAPVFADERQAAAHRSHALIEAIDGRDTVRAYRIADHEITAIARASGRTRDLSMTAFTLFTRLVGRANRAEFVGLAAILVIGFCLTSAGAVTVGATTAAALMFHRLFNPIGMILYSAADLQLAATGVARLIGVTHAQTASSPPEPSQRRGDDDVVLQDVHFSYRTGRPVLRGVDLRIPPGTRVALVGSSGAGKSTVAGLLGATLVPDHGVVGVPAGEGVYMISQEVHIFAGPLIDDLRLPAPRATRPEVDAALATVGALDWVRTLPDGVDTIVGDGGHRIGGARAQQLALARLILADPRIVVLDEATAEAGSHHATELDAAAEAATRGRTVLVIAHRLSQIRAVDEVAVIDNGVITENGPPDDLIDAGGDLARMWRGWSPTIAGAPTSQPASQIPADCPHNRPEDAR